MTAAEVAARIHPDIPERTVKRNWATGKWPYTPIGKLRGMTEDQLRDALASDAVAASNPPSPAPVSGLSARSRHRTAS